MTAPDVAARTAANEALFAPLGPTSAKEQCTVCGSYEPSHGHGPDGTER